MPRNTNPAWDTAVTAEAAWFTSDPPTGWVGTAPPPLQAANGGAFDTVQAFRPLICPAGKHLFIYRDYGAPQAETVGEMGEGRYWDHRLVAHLVWSFTESTGAGEDMEQHLETAIAAVLARIRGPVGDRSHGGAFTDVADVRNEPEVRYVGDPYDQLEAANVVQVKIHYGATDHFMA
jgi:hypothetical protein